MTSLTTFNRLGLATLLGTIAQSALSADALLSADQLLRLSPLEQRAHVERVIARQRATPAPSAAADTTPPVLTVFNAAAAINLTKHAQPFRITIKGTDDMSGLKRVIYQATGPSGQIITGSTDDGFPALNYSGSAGLVGVNQFLEPGTWAFTYAYGWDWAGNYFFVDAAGLAALGNTVFTVSNLAGYDLIKPVLVSGKVLSPSVSLSAVINGTASEDPAVGVKLTFTDAGNPAVSGTYSAGANFCQVASPPTKCFTIEGYTSTMGQASETLTLVGQVSAARGQVPGEYELYSVYVHDHAYNSTSLTSTLFGGETDFKTLLPATIIKLKP
jgi:hypothetical protein